jgi:hypothetical protein
VISVSSARTTRGEGQLVIGESLRCQVGDLRRAAISLLRGKEPRFRHCEFFVGEQAIRFHLAEAFKLACK